MTHTPSTRRRVSAQQMVALIIIIQCSILGGHSSLWSCVNTVVTIQPFLQALLTNCHPLHAYALVYLHMCVQTQIHWTSIY